MSTKARNADYRESLDYKFGQTSEPVSPIEPDGRCKLFDITAVIGTVYADHQGDFSPRQIAFLQIEGYFSSSGRLPNTFTFPEEDGTLIHMILDVEPKKD